VTALPVTHTHTHTHTPAYHRVATTDLSDRAFVYHRLVSVTYATLRVPPRRDWARQFYAEFCKKKIIRGPRKHQICGGNVRKYGAELFETNCRGLVPQGSGHVDGAILLATGWSRYHRIVA